MTDTLYYGLVIVTTLCYGVTDTEKCMEYHSTFVQQEPFYSEDTNLNEKWCADSKVFVEKDMNEVFSDYTVKSMECSFKVIPYLSKDMLKHLKNFE